MPSLGSALVSSLMGFLLHLLCASAWDRNTFHMLIHNMSDILNVSDCWACAHPPRHLQTGGWPIMPTACFDPADWNHTHLYTTTLAKGAPTKDPDQFALSHHESWPLAYICVTWHSPPAPKDSPSSDDQVPPSQLGDYPRCNCTMNIGRMGHLSTPSCLPQYLQDNQRVNMSINQLRATYSAFTDVTVLGLPPGVFWICGSWAGRVLPAAWNGSCTMGTLGPAGIQFYPKQQPASAWDPPHYRRKRAFDPSLGYDPERTYMSEGKRFGAIMFPAWGVGLNVAQIRRLSYQLEALANSTATLGTDLQAEISSISQVMLQYRLGLDFLLSTSGGFCRWLNQSRCCHLLDLKGKIITDVKAIREVSAAIQNSYSNQGDSFIDWLGSFLPGAAWVREILVTIIGFILLIAVVGGLIRCAVSYVVRTYSLVR